MRGIVSLAAALALPTPGPSSTPFPFRSEILLITFIVILFTLVVQGLSLSPLIGWLGIEDDGAEAEEEAMARRGAAEAGLRALEEANGAPWVRPNHIDTLREHYRAQLRTTSELNWARDGSFAEAAQFRRLRRATLEAERAAVIALRNEGAISDEVLLRVEQELDVETLRLGNGSAAVPA